MVPTFPILGPEHILRQREVRTLVSSAAIAATFEVALVAALLFGATRTAQIVEPHHESRMRPAPPPVFSKPVQTRPSFSDPVNHVAPLEHSIPDPVDYDFTAPVDVVDGSFLEAPGREVVGNRDDFAAAGDASPFPAPVNFPGPDDFVAADEMPVLLRLDRPEYPELARSAGIEGMVRLRVLVDAQGKVAQVIVDAGVPLLTESAVAAAEKALFRPALLANRPVAVWVVLPVRFTLNG